MGFRRKHSRFHVAINGRLERGSLSAPCTVVDVSETGVQIESRLYVKNGETLRLVIDLDQGRRLACELKVVNVRAPKLGAKIVSISPEDQERLTELLDDRVQIGSYRG